MRRVATGDLRHARWLFVASLGLVVAAFGLFVGSERAADPATYYRYRVVAGASAVVLAAFGLFFLADAAGYLLAAAGTG